MPASLPIPRARCRVGIVLGALSLAIAACGGAITDTRHAAQPGPSQTATLRRARNDSPFHTEPSPWMLLQELPSLRRATTRERSQHFSGDVESETLANRLAETYPTLGPTQRLPAGAVLVAAHYRVDSERPIAYFAMIKQRSGFDLGGGDWEYLVIRPTGEIEQRGRLTLCARCHAEAPRDSLFGRIP